MPNTTTNHAITYTNYRNKISIQLNIKGVELKITFTKINET